jgi:hypothetical protein
MERQLNLLPCGCRWRRVRALRVAGVVIGGDVLMQCARHAKKTRRAIEQEKCAEERVLQRESDLDLARLLKDR